MGGQPAIQISYNVEDKPAEAVFTVKDGKKYFVQIDVPGDYLKATDPFNKIKESFKFL